MKKTIIVVVVILIIGILGWQKGWFNGTGLAGGQDILKSLTSRQEDLGDGSTKYVFESSTPKQGFEITVLPFDEAGPLTKERILQDLPDMVIKNEKNITINNGNIQALSFESEDQDLGATFEIWFIYNGNLYEAQTYPEFALQMTEVLVKSWQDLKL